MTVKNDLIEKYPDSIQELTNSLVNTGNFIENNTSEAITIGAEFLQQKADIINNVITNPPDRVITNELFTVIEDLETIQNYMVEKMNVLKGKIDMEKFVNTQFVKEAGAVYFFYNG